MTVLPYLGHEQGTFFRVRFHFFPQSAEVQMLLADSVFHDTCQRHIFGPQKYRVCWGLWTKTNDNGVSVGKCYPCDAYRRHTIKNYDYCLVFPSSQVFGLVWTLLFCFMLPYLVDTLKR